jgi:hypothetical protein
MGINLAQLLTDSASRYGTRPALKLDDAVVTYKMLNEGANLWLAPSRTAASSLGIASR